ncbi:MAG TPA: Na+/H+ antiporter [Planctomycetota bacterium]|nr:Na+/H+ antiporter [Planctomycetota bacterium]
MHSLEIVLILLGLAAALELLAHKINVPHPALLVLGGLVLALIPGLPHIELDPEAVFIVFIPPLLFRAAITTSWRDFRSHLRAILTLAVLLLLGTVLGVAWIAHSLTSEFTWPAAFVLGAIISPPDAVAAVAVMRRLGAPRSVVTILEGEGLVNDATALVAYRVAMTAVVAGSFSVGHASVQFLIAAAGGIAMGVATALVVIFIRRKIGRSPLVENTISILTPFASFIPADRIGVSGVLAVVATGLSLGRIGPRLVSPQTRLQAQALWDMIVFLLEGLIFILIGLYLPASFDALRQHTLRELLEYAAVISLIVVLIRLLGVFPAAYGLRFIARVAGAKWSYPKWQHVAFIGWAGMRGGDSLVIALALPLLTSAGRPFPARDLIIFITFSVILVTLVLQGFTFGWACRLLGLRDDGLDREEENRARKMSLEAGLAYLEQVAQRPDAPMEHIDDLRDRHARRLHHLMVRDQPVLFPEKRGHLAAYRRIRMEMLQAERKALIELRDQDQISDGVLITIQRDLDLEATLLSQDDDATT